MKHRVKNTLRALAKHLGIKVQFVDYFGPDVHGKLIPRERRILINAHKPRCEHVFTVLHELGHFLIHFKNPPRKYHPRFLDIHWKTEWLARVCSKGRRYFRFLFNKQSGKEWEADLWAMCAFILVAKHTGCRNELLAFLERHPGKFKLFLLALYGFTYSRAKATIIKYSKLLWLPFQLMNPLARKVAIRYGPVLQPNRRLNHEKCFSHHRSRLSLATR